MACSLLNPILITSILIDLRSKTKKLLLGLFEDKMALISALQNLVAHILGNKMNYAKNGIPHSNQS